MRGLITLVFDDGYEAVFKRVVPLLATYSIPAVFALPLETEALAQQVGQPITPWPAWLPLRQDGHEIAAHGIRHTDLRQLSPEELENELRLPHETLSATTLVYPGGAHNDAVVGATKKYYSAARTTRYGFESAPPGNPWQLSCVDYTQDNWSVTRANLRALWAVATNSWLIETYHFIDPGSDGIDISQSPLHHSVPLKEFTRHIEFIRKLPVAIKTVDEVIRHNHH